MGMTFGGLQKKMVRLVMLVLCLAIGALAVVSFFQDRMLIRLVEGTRIEQQQAISGTCRRYTYRATAGYIRHFKGDDVTGP